MYRISYSLTKYWYLKKVYFFKNKGLIIIPTNVKDPIIAATNTVSAIDAKGSPTTAINIEYTRMINPINANNPKIIDLKFINESLSSFFVSPITSDSFLDILFFIDSSFRCIL